MKNCITGLYPSTKFFFMLAVIVFSAIVPGYMFQYMMLPVILVICMLSGHLKKFLGIFLKSILIIVLFIFVIQTFIVTYGDEVPLFSFLHFSQTGFDTSINMTSKIIAISSIIIWFFQVTSVKDMICALEKAGVPRKIVFVAASTIQLVPQMSMLSKTITDAQKSRGVEMEGNILIRAKAFIPMIGPLVLSSIQQTEERVLALESRAFSFKARKTTIYEIRKAAIDYILDVLIAISIIGYFVWRCM